MVIRKCDMCGKIIESDEIYRTVEIAPSNGFIETNCGTTISPGVIEDGDLCVDCAKKLKEVIEGYKDIQIKLETYKEKYK